MYREDSFDLLQAGKPKVEVRENNKSEIVLDGLTRKEVNTYDEIQELLRVANAIRSTSATAMNNQSSRSHAIFTVYIHVISVTDGTEFVWNSKLNIVDLAGSERIKKTGASGNTLKEGIAINQGLLALGNVIDALSKRSQNTSASVIHIPYRDSKITRLLKDSLGGNSLTVLIACISPADIHYEETINTLRFASRAMDIVNTTQVNVSLQGNEHGDTSMYSELVPKLKQEIAQLQTCLRQLQHAEQSKSIASSAHLWQTTYSSMQLLRYTISQCVSEDVLLDENALGVYLETILHSFKQQLKTQFEYACKQANNQSLELPRCLDDELELELMKYMPVAMKIMEEIQVVSQWTERIAKLEGQALRSILPNLDDTLSNVLLTNVEIDEEMEALLRKEEEALRNESAPDLPELQDFDFSMAETKEDPLLAENDVVIHAKIEEMNSIDSHLMEVRSAKHTTSFFFFLTICSLKRELRI